jgi:predicted dinucleotide-binding enzyme
VIDDIQLDGFVTADNAEAKQQVLSVVQSLGFHPIDSGPLAMSRVLEGIALLNISLNMSNNWSWQTGLEAPRSNELTVSPEFLSQ